jgi:ABC-2 type transport system permease protein
MFAIYRKEMRSYFINPIGYVYMGIFLVFSALLCCYTTIMSGSYSTASYFTFLIFTFIILIPVLTMRLFAEERKLRTEQLLLTAPIKITSMVLGKFLAALTMFGGTLLLSSVSFLPLYIYGAAERASSDYTALHIGPVTAEILGCLIGVFLIGAAFLAIGLFVSSLCENQLSAAVITIAVLACTIVLSLANQYINTYSIRFVLDWICILSRFANFSYGMFDWSALLYYISITSVFLFLTVRVYDRRRWN